MEQERAMTVDTVDRPEIIEGSSETGPAMPGVVVAERGGRQWDE